MIATIAREWTRIGCVGFGGPPAHMALLRDLVVERRGWMDEAEFADAIAACQALAGPYVVLVLLACGALESGRRVLAVAVPVGGGGIAWVALKVGALSYGGGFVIVPLMQHDAVDRYGWMTDGQFLSAVALGQVTPGPVVHTVAAVGYAAAGVGGALLAAAVAFAPSFGFVLIGGSRFDALRANPTVRAFLDGAGPAAVGAILGSAVPLALALDRAWQAAVLGAALVALLVLRRGVVVTLVVAGMIGAVIG